MKTGADISHWQASFNAARYKAAGEDFIILKATEGPNFIDTTFRTRWNDAEANKLPRIAYHFARPDGGYRDQADHFIEVVKSAGFTKGCSWALDMEDAGSRSGSQLVAWADAWCQRVRGALPNKGLFYSYIPFIKSQMGNPGRVPGNCAAWVARYRTDDPYALPIGRPAGWPIPPHVWQCGDGVAGCIKDVASIGKCDYNRMTDAAFVELFSSAAEEDDMYDAAAEKRLMDALEDWTRKGVRWTDHGDETVAGAGNHLEKIRQEIADFEQTVLDRLTEIENSIVAPVPTPPQTVGFDGELKGE